MNRSLPRFLYYLLTATLLQSIVFAQSPVERAMPDPLRLLQDTASITGGSMATDESFREDNAKVLRDRLQQAERRGRYYYYDTGCYARVGRGCYRMVSARYCY